MVEQRLKSIGTGMTLGITVPFAAMVRAVDKGAGSFEMQMKKVEAALAGISGDELKQLSGQARTFGPEVGKGASEAASGIEMLARNGLNAAQIMGGALKSSLELAAAGATELAPAADLVTDVMVQFKRSTADLPDVVGNVVGAMDASKFGFADFQLALAQGGGVAASAGVSFLDFSTAVAATSAQFSSGSDAGTSFKTYLQSLVGNSKQAKQAMQKLGISFFNANGQMKPLSEQSEILRKALGNLTDESKTEALKTIFGSDASRTAIGLMEQGAEGFNKLQEAIAGGDVEAKIAKRLEGSEAAGKRISVAWESVKVALGVDTGLLDIVTAIKNGFATMLEAIAKAPPVFLKIGAAFSALGAAIGPLLFIVGHVGAVILANFAASKFGLIGRALALVISPISTLVGMLGEAGLVRALTLAGSRFVALLGPVGLVISAFLLFKDEIIFALEAVWKRLTETLGPPIEALFAKLSALFEKLTGGPVGSAIEGLMSLLDGLADVVGTLLVGVIMEAGEVIERALSAVVAAFSGAVDIISGVVDVVSALLSGDFSGAWEAAGRVVEAVFDTIINIIAAFVPEISAPLQQAWTEAKKWLADGFKAIVGWFTGWVQSGVEFVASAFPNVVTAAKSVYQGVKGWLVDKFGALMRWIGNAAKWIGDKYAALKKRLGLGEASNDNGPEAPPEPKPGEQPAPAPKTSVNFDEEGSGRKKKGRDAAADAREREQMRNSIELEAARLRGDKEAEKAIRARLDLLDQITAYQRTGLSLEAATAAAKRDMAVLEAARREGLEKDLLRDEAAHQIDLARITENRTLEETLERQEELKDRILSFQRDGLSLEEATARAMRQQLEIDAARSQIRERLLAEDEQDRQLALAKMRGDSEERIRQLQREIDIRDRQRELERDFQMSPQDAQEQASREWDEMEKARQAGVFRDTFKDGVRAAMDGDLKGWIKDWWKDRVAKGMEEALNSLADLISNLFSKVGSGSASGGGGGLVGAIGSLVGGIFGSKKAPGFKTGGSFKVAGRSGIDANLISFRATAGEIVNIERPGNDNGPNSGTTNNFYGPGADAFWSEVTGRAAAVASPMASRAAVAGSTGAQVALARKGSRTIP
ncbi:phage tail tape measure protein [Novosphingobium sp. BW1]|uniref:phage tail tape measure protein n=1 Tax=Novosphingobium sp. BW1 TaxID=2592621 RepID=UPI001F084A40|nr:phage tail tape measure protein [Novosphingobium sp. BW1]